MRVVPKRVDEKITWSVIHAERWIENAGAIGTTPDVVAAFAAKVEKAREAKRAADEARTAAKFATQALQQALDEMSSAAAGIVLQVRAKAMMTNDPGVYPLAAIPSPETASTIAPPGKPVAFGVALSQTGAIDLTWKCKNPRGSTGVMYDVWRRVQPSGEEVYLGSTGKKRFRDATIPAGAVALTYRVRGKRSTAVGPAGDFNVTFGTVAGRMTAGTQTKESRVTGLMAA